MPLLRDVSTPERAAFWPHVRNTAAEVRARPPWAQHGVIVDPRHFEDFAPAGVLQIGEPRDADTSAGPSGA